MLSAFPDPRSRPSDGMLIEASILARVLGIRLLKLEATIALVPADVRIPSAAPPVAQPRTDAHRPHVPPRRSIAAGGGLAEAVRSIDDGARLLAEARRRDT